MAKTPVRAHALEAALTGAALTPHEIERAVASAVLDISPSSDAIASEWYRKAVLPVHLRRLLST
jgi:CO/xanthine dehydrogenase FAD-binding subunit